MCGRFTLTTTADELHERFGVCVPQNVPPRWNIAPSQPSIIFRQSGLEISTSFAEFGLLMGQNGKRIINARAETVSEKPTFRDAFSVSRCLVPASGWYEWAGKGRPFHVQLADARVMAFAGLYFKSGSPSQAGQFVILTTAAEAELAKVHHRSPLVLPVSNWQSWLSGAEVEAEPVWFLLWHAILIFILLHLRSVNISQDNASLVAPSIHQDTSFRQSCKAIYSRVNFLPLACHFQRGSCANATTAGRLLRGKAATGVQIRPFLSVLAVYLTSSTLDCFHQRKVISWPGVKI